MDLEIPRGGGGGGGGNNGGRTLLGKRTLSGERILSCERTLSGDTYSGRSLHIVSIPNTLDCWQLCICMAVWGTLSVYMF